MENIPNYVPKTPVTIETYEKCKNFYDALIQKLQLAIDSNQKSASIDIDSEIVPYGSWLIYNNDYFKERLDKSKQIAIHNFMKDLKKKNYPCSYCFITDKDDVSKTYNYRSYISIILE